ncbi:MAG: replication-associated recombination protein A [Acidimicrobiales bacterium]
MSGSGLFDAAVDVALASRAPLAARMRPRHLADMVGQMHLLAPDAPLRAMVEADRVSSMIIWGPPGTGKTTLARLVAEATAKEFVPLSAVTAGVKDVRLVIEDARHRLGEQGRGTILFLDEVHRFNKSQQDALLPSVEDGLIVLIGATTENPFFEVNAPLMSRSTLFRTERLSPEDLDKLARRALEHEGMVAEEEALEHLIAGANGDARSVLGSLEVAMAAAELRTGKGDRSPTAHRAGGQAGSGTPGSLTPGSLTPGSAQVPVRIMLVDAEAARGARALTYGQDEHYDIASAFIKSIRGSDPDAGLYWLARMLEAGEDARFIARRLVILASEDVGMADPLSLLVADAAARAVEFVGLPEAALNLAQATVHLACAPKSNRVTVALARARHDVTDLPAGPVPAHLRDSHYRGAQSVGHGLGYEYPHDDPRAWVDQEHRPVEVAGRTYYEPSEQGREKETGLRMQRLGKDRSP